MCGEVLIERGETEDRAFDQYVRLPECLSQLAPDEAGLRWIVVERVDADAREKRSE